MKYYLKLQLRIIQRNLISYGIKPYLGFVILVVLFIFFSNLFFQKVSYPEYLYIFFSLSILIYLNGKRRNDFLRLLNSNKEYLKIRLVENMILTLPFELFLLYKHEIIQVVILFITSTLLVFYTNKNKFLFTIPTPFNKKPFEFNIGFRNQFLLIIFCYMVSIISVYVKNFNLGLFSLLLLQFVITTFYYKPEEKYFVWIFNLSSKVFLIEKIKTSILYTLILCSPITILLIIQYHEPKIVLTIIGLQLLSILFITTSVLGKYSTFPSTLNPIQIFSIIFCVSFPPLLILVIPFLYLKSTQKLKYILE